MVERFNRSLLQLLRCYTETEDDWEEFLPMVMYAYESFYCQTPGWIDLIQVATQ